MNVVPSQLVARAISHSTEDPEKVLKALKNVVGEVEIKRTTAKGYFGNEILVFSAVIRRRKEILKVLDRIMEEDENRKYVLSFLSEKIDDNLRLHIRVDKQEAYFGRIRVIEGEDVISLVFSFRVYPRKRENLERWLKERYGSPS